MKAYKFRSITVLLIMLACALSFSAAAQPANSVTMSNLAFHPDTLTVPAGTTVMWTNDDTTTHTVTSDEGLFDSGNIATGGQFSHLFSSPGTYPYHCKIHPTVMHGTIVVTSGATTAVSSAYSSMNATQAITGATQSAASQYSQYSQYYSMPKGAAPMMHISAPQKYEVTGKEPANIYPMGQTQAMPYSQYQTYATYTGGNSLWIRGATSWSQFAVVPQGASLSLLAISPTGGNGYLYEIYPNGRLVKNNFYFYPYNIINFYADTIGQHILLFVIDDKVSNAVVIDIVAYQPYQQPYQQPTKQQTSYQQTTGQQTNYQQSSSPQSGYSSNY